MRIVDVCAFYAPEGGGVRTCVDQKLATGPQFGHEIVVIAPGDRDHIEERCDGGRIEWLASPRLPVDRRYRYFSRRRALFDRLDSLRPDIVEASSPWRAASIVAEWQGGAPRALVMHADPLAAYLYRWLEAVARPARVDRQFGWFWRRLQRLASGFDAVISANSSLTRRLEEQGLGRLVTNPMGVSGQFFSPRLRDEGLRRRMLERCALPPEAALLLGVGRHAPEKRWPMIVEAVQAASFSHPVGLVLVGAGRDTGRILRKIDGNPHVHLLSPITDRMALARLMASADALVHGCEAETFSLVVAEAAASGLPLIVPDRGGAADQIAAHGDFTFEAGNPAAAADAIAAYLVSGAHRPRRPVRTLSDHFRQLFDCYAALARGHRPLWRQEAAT